ncbi:hypothetical protein Trco_005499 [Trichoderma cornu-damae]|uniref:Small acidic protein-like domain-containing protein n=1 Tax=Trichoderma cornu-damae TaxID=654480 RepID=A0A9P8QJH6_9HYPO|nr:hypothetical protein Trco_005499 [Trichoderma cornu-damae]
MGTSADNTRADASGQANQERKLKKKARKAERKAKKMAASAEKETRPLDQKAALDGQETPAKGKKEKKQKALEMQLSQAEEKRRHYLALSKRLETDAKQMLKQAEDATNKYQQMTKALEEIKESGDSKRLSDLMLDDRDDFGSLDDQDVDIAMEDIPGNSETISTLKADAHVAPEKEEIKEQETKDEKKKKKKDKKKKSDDVEVAKAEVPLPSQEAEEKPKKKKKKPKSNSDEGSNAREQAHHAKADVADGKRKRQDDNAEDPVSKKGKKEKKSHGGEQETQAAKEEFKIQGLEGGAARQDKFLRLLGGKKAGASTAKPGGITASKGDSVRAEAAIQRQYEAGMLLKESGHKRRGLGA